MLINRRWFWLLLVLVAPFSVLQAAEKLPFQEGRFEKGELKYVNHLPVLSVEGTPEEMGRQEAALTGAVVKVLAAYPQQLMMLSGRGPTVGQMCRNGPHVDVACHAGPSRRTAEFRRESRHLARSAHGRQYDHGPVPGRLCLLFAHGRAGQEPDRRRSFRTESRLLSPWESSIDMDSSPSAGPRASMPSPPSAFRE